MLLRSSSWVLPAKTSRSAFTLVEMLVVLGIIGILIALILPAVMGAMTRARQAAIALEIKQIAAGFDTYKQQRNEYPPSFGERNSSGALLYNITSGSPSRYTSAVERHLQACYPKYVNKNNFYTGGGGFPGAMEIDQGEALVVWLRFLGTNHENPIDTVSTRNVYFEFDDRRLVDFDGDGIPTYRPRNCRDTDYIYMESRCYISYVQNNGYARCNGPATQQIVPYGSAPTVPVNPKTFQIVCAGLDGDFGTLPNVSGSTYSPKIFPLGTGYYPADRDNIANFSDGKTLGDSRPQ